jgi:hypothetical protein
MDGNVTDFNGCWELESDLPNMAPVNLEPRTANNFVLTLEP